MSSNGLPTLTIDLRRRRAEQAGAMLLSLLGGMAPLLMGSFVGWPLRIAGSLLLALCICGCFRAAGWLGGSAALARMTWAGDGVWALVFADGREYSGQLRSDTRMSPAAIWLRWDLLLPPSPVLESQASRRGPRSRALLLIPGDIPADDFRRLLVRLRVDQSECAPTAQQTDPTPSS